MGALLTVLVNFILSFLIQLLPLSPFVDIRLDETMNTGLGWLNWFVDLDGMVRLMGAVLILGLTYSAVTLVLRHVDLFIGKAMG